MRLIHVVRCLVLDLFCANGKSLWGIEVLCSDQCWRTLLVMGKDPTSVTRRAWRLGFRLLPKGVSPVSFGEPWVHNDSPFNGYSRETVTDGFLGARGLRCVTQGYWRNQLSACVKRLDVQQVIPLCQVSPMFRAYILLGMCGAHFGSLYLDVPSYVKAMGLSRADALEALRQAVDCGFLQIRRYLDVNGMENQCVSTVEQSEERVWLTEGLYGHGLSEAADLGWEIYLRDLLDPH